MASAFAVKAIDRQREKCNKCPLNLSVNLFNASEHSVLFSGYMVISSRWAG
jgi:hypothetical protein